MIGDRPKHIARLVFACALGALLALLFWVLRPNDTTFEQVQRAAASPPRSDGVSATAAGARSPATQRPSELSTAPSGVGVDSAPIPAQSDARLTSPAAADLPAPPAPSVLGTASGDAEDRNAVMATRKTSPERPAQWCFLKTRDDHDYLSDLRLSGTDRAACGWVRRTTPPRKAVISARTSCGKASTPVHFAACG